MIRIIAIGAPFGDDAVGLVVGRRLAAAPPPNCEVCIRDRPGLELIDDLAGATAVLLIDAVQSGGAPGDILDMDVGANHPLPGTRSTTSTHGIGVAEALALAVALGKLPSSVHLLGIEVATPIGPGDLGRDVAAALAEVERRARAWAAAAVKVRGCCS